jgi:transcriptional regulator with XRE-family HTH domain
MSAIIVAMDKARTGRRLMAAAHPAEVGARLAAAMTVAGIKQADLCRQVGFSSAQVSQWIRGKNRPSLENLALMLPYLDVDPNYLLFGDDAHFNYAKRDALLSAYRAAKAETEEAAAPAASIR